MPNNPDFFPTQAELAIIMDRAALGLHVADYLQPKVDELVQGLKAHGLRLLKHADGTFETFTIN